MHRRIVMRMNATHQLPLMPHRIRMRHTTSRDCQGGVELAALARLAIDLAACPRESLVTTRGCHCRSSRDVAIAGTFFARASSMEGGLIKGMTCKVCPCSKSSRTRYLPLDGAATSNSQPLILRDGKVVAWRHRAHKTLLCCSRMSSLRCKTTCG
jgi:hypothetical protein